jgi:alkanesulfonate monooxygenase SsuD/methylene tetrahydromethanopterin reductase-like flavin-dependent oxidoreductase (luciferase family)
VAVIGPWSLWLGLGLGWNDVEYEALGVPFRRRGRRLEEQIALMRRLWRDRWSRSTASSTTSTPPA